MVMLKMLYKPLGLLISVAGGIAAGAIFTRVWTLVTGQGDKTFNKIPRGIAPVIPCAGATGAGSLCRGVVQVPPFGFTREGVPPWLPQPRHWAARTVGAESDDPNSMLSRYRNALALRHSLKALGDDEMLSPTSCPRLTESGFNDHQWLKPSVVGWTRQSVGGS